MNHARLDEAAEITPGFSNPGAVQHQDNGRFLVIQPRHVHESGRPVSIGEDHDTRMDLPERAEGYCVMGGDVLFMSRGEKNRAARIDQCAINAVPTAAFFVLRPRPGLVDPEYLAWFLNQAPTQAAISQARTGAGTPIVQRALFEAICIPLPPMHQQGYIAHLSELQQKEQEILGRMTQAVALRNRSIGLSFLTNTSR